MGFGPPSFYSTEYGMMNLQDGGEGPRGSTVAKRQEWRDQKCCKSSSCSENAGNRPYDQVAKFRREAQMRPC